MIRLLDQLCKGLFLKYSYKKERRWIFLSITTYFLQVILINQLTSCPQHGMVLPWMLNAVYDNARGIYASES